MLHFPYSKQENKYDKNQYDTLGRNFIVLKINTYIEGYDGHRVASEH